MLSALPELMKIRADSGARMDFLTFPIIAILSIFGLGLYTGYDSIVFDPISSPKWAQDQGYSPRVLTRQLTDEMRAIRLVPAR